MSLGTICQEATCFVANWSVELRVTSMIRKIGFLELNKYLKDNDVINRYKRNVELKEVFEGGYSKTVSSMIRDLILHIFTGIDIDAISLEKQRGYAQYNFTMRMPANQAAFQRVLTDLEGLRGNNFLSWTTWNVRAGGTCLFHINFGRLAVMARSPHDASMSLATFIQSLRGLAEKVRECHPAPVVVAPQTVVAAVATAAPVTVPATDTVNIGDVILVNGTNFTVTAAPAPEPERVPAPTRTTPIVLRRIN